MPFVESEFHRLTWTEISPPVYYRIDPIHPIYGYRSKAVTLKDIKLSFSMLTPAKAKKLLKEWECPLSTI